MKAAVPNGFGGVHDVPPWAFEPGAALAEFGEEPALVEIVTSALHTDRSGWTVDVRPPYCLAAPPGRPIRTQGWKLHVSATVLSAAVVLERVLPVVLANGCHFKVLRSLRDLAALNAVHAPPGRSGKFVTIYPKDDVEAVAIATACDRATAGLPGPRILSDRPFRPGSLVHYRYGGFDERLVRWTLLEQREEIVIGPGGDPVADVSGGRFAPPAWAVDPFPREALPMPTASRSDGVLWLGRFRIDRLVLRSNRGGIYRAIGPEGRRVVLKEARPHVATDRFGREACDRLRHEREMLAILAPRSLCPAPIELFEGGGHLFLAMEDVGRRSLREEIVRGAAGRGRPLEEQALLALARQLVALLAGAHAEGVVLRDLNPGNLIRGDDGTLRVVDLEAAYRMGDPAPWYRAATPAYASPQQEGDLRPTPADDVFSLGATLYFAATATDPFFFADDEGGRAVVQKAEELLRLHRTPPWAGDLIRSCLSPSPATRPAVAEIAKAIEPTARVAFPVGLPPEPTPDELERAVDGVLAYLDAARAARAGDRLWPTTSLGRRTDPLNVANGNAGSGSFSVGR